jgi:hypothetical protein
MKRITMAAVAVCLIASACNSSTASPSITPDPAATATPTISPATPSPTATAGPSDSPTATPTPAVTSSPLPTGVAGALEFMQQYENSLVGTHYDKAWSMLAPGYQALVGPESKYVNDQAEFMESAGKGYNVVANPADVAALAEWLKNQPFASAIDRAHAVVVEVTWSALATANRPAQVWIVNPTPSGWELYEVR